jgi:prolyl oligopeptidase
MTFPPTRRVAVTDSYFGTEVDDPYRWLEGPSTDSEISAWVRAQAQYARNYLDDLGSRESIRSQLEMLACLPSETAPKRKGTNWFRFTDDGTAEQPVYRTTRSPSSALMSACRGFLSLSVRRPKGKSAQLSA